jgi:hypothetical protein
MNATRTPRGESKFIITLLRRAAVWLQRIVAADGAFLAGAGAEAGGHNDFWYVAAFAAGAPGVTHLDIDQV